MHHSLSDYLMDLVQNSVEAKSTLVLIDFIERDGELRLCIADNGVGMDEETLKKVRNPFFTDGEKHKTRHVGLGISFLEQLATQCEGGFDIVSEKGVGTSIQFRAPLNHPDLPPVGNIVTTILCCMDLEGDFDLQFRRDRDGECYAVVKSELIEAVGDLRDAQSLIAVRSYMQSLEKNLIQKGI